MIIVNWVDDGEVRESHFTDPLEGLDFITSLKALDVSFTAINIPEAMTCRP